MKTVKTIKTNIKFYQGLNGEMNRLYGFVTKTKGSWKGCRADEAMKKIVFVDRAIAKDIVPNLLYHCTLFPTRSNSTFLAKHARLMKFPAKIESISNKGVYRINVKFGNKVLVYDPASTDPMKNDIQKIAGKIKSRQDLQNPWIVAEDFINAACMVKRLCDQRQSRCSADK